MKPVPRRIAILIAAAACLVAGVAFVAERLVTAGGGSYGDFFILLIFTPLVLATWTVGASVQFYRGSASALQALTASVLALLALIVLGVAIGLRG
jgi:hypothetical protein